MKFAADAPARPHPRQKNLQVQIGETSLNILFTIDFGLDGVPSQPRFDL
jgi:hypothetical protein